MGQKAIMLIHTQFSKIFRMTIISRKGEISMKFVANRPIILASKSPRREELLAILGIPFEVMGSNVLENEEEISSLDLADYAKVLAVRKAKAVAKRYPEAAIIGADTIVGLEGRIFPKPENSEEAKLFLQKLSGQTHSVVTAVAIVTGEEVVAFAHETKVSFYELDDGLIDAYIATGDPLDKAGAYGIQSGGAFFVKEIKGDYYSVMGLPIAMLARQLQLLNILSLKGGATKHDN